MSARTPSAADRARFVEVCSCGSRSRGLFGNATDCAAWAVPFTGRRYCDGPDVSRDVIHTWQSTGLDEVGGQLCSTRRCYRCGTREFKPYSGKGAWQR